MTKKSVVRCCRECFKPLGAAKATAIFCGVPCKASWNNRRKARGAELYDLFMNQRFNRVESKRLTVWSEMCRLAEGWNDEDKAEKRLTFANPTEVLTRLRDRGSLRRGVIYRNVR